MAHAGARVLAFTATVRFTFEMAIWRDVFAALVSEVGEHPVSYRGANGK
jgi:hypothetical protein